MRKLFRRILCRLGFHDWLTPYDRVIWESDAIKVTVLEQRCGYCPAVEAAGHEGDPSDRAIDVELARKALTV